MDSFLPIIDQSNLGVGEKRSKTQGPRASVRVDGALAKSLRRTRSRWERGTYERVTRGYSRGRPNCGPRGPGGSPQGSDDPGGG